MAKSIWTLYRHKGINAKVAWNGCGKNFSQNYSDQFNYGFDDILPRSSPIDFENRLISNHANGT